MNTRPASGHVLPPESVPRDRQLLQPHSDMFTISKMCFVCTWQYKIRGSRKTPKKSRKFLAIQVLISLKLTNHLNWTQLTHMEKHMEAREANFSNTKDRYMHTNDNVFGTANHRAQKPSWGQRIPFTWPPSPATVDEKREPSLEQMRSQQANAPTFRMVNGPIGRSESNPRTSTARSAPSSGPRISNVPDDQDRDVQQGPMGAGGGQKAS